MSDKIFNWAFTLNTGGLAVTITFMGAAIKWQNVFSYKELIPFVVVIIIFGLGIISIVIAACSEHKRFYKKGRLLDNFFNEFNELKITGDAFIKKLPPKISCYDWIVPKFEKASYVLFFLGLIIGVGILICRSSA